MPAKNAGHADVLVDLRPMNAYGRHLDLRALRRRGREKSRIPPQRRAQDAPVAERDYEKPVASRRENRFRSVRLDGHL